MFAAFARFDAACSRSQKVGDVRRRLDFGVDDGRGALGSESLFDFAHAAEHLLHLLDRL